MYGVGQRGTSAQCHRECDPQCDSLYQKAEPWSKFAWSAKAHRAGRVFALWFATTARVFPESELKNIFQPFYRVADARDRQSGGTGLGLAIADRVVRIHGGTIHAENACLAG